MTPRRLHLVAPPRKLLLPLHPPFWNPLQELFPCRQDARSPEEKGGGRLPVSQSKCSISSGRPVTPDERSANHNTATQRSTHPRSTVNDLPEMRSTPVEHPHSFHLLSACHSLPSQRPIKIRGPASRQDHSEFWGLYKPAQSDPRQDSTVTHYKR